MVESNEQKPARRIPLQLAINIRKSYARQIKSGTLLNISLSGAFLKTNMKGLEANEKLNLTFSVGSRTRNLSAHVIWTNQYGAGIRFEHTNNRDQQIVDDLMYFIEENRQDRKQVLNDIFKLVS